MRNSLTSGETVISWDVKGKVGSSILSWRALRAVPRKELYSVIQRLSTFAMGTQLGSEYLRTATGMKGKACGWDLAYNSHFSPLTPV